MSKVGESVMETKIRKQIVRNENYQVPKLELHIKKNSYWANHVNIVLFTWKIILHEQTVKRSKCALINPIQDDVK